MFWNDLSRRILKINLLFEKSNGVKYRENLPGIVDNDI